MGVNYDANVVIREDMFFVSSILGIIFGGWIYKSLICGGGKGGGGGVVELGV